MVTIIKNVEVHSGATNQNLFMAPIMHFFVFFLLLLLQKQ